MPVMKTEKRQRVDAAWMELQIQYLDFPGPLKKDAWVITPLKRGRDSFKPEPLVFGTQREKQIPSGAGYRSW